MYSDCDVICLLSDNEEDKNQNHFIQQCNSNNNTVVSLKSNHSINVVNFEWRQDSFTVMDFLTHNNKNNKTVRNASCNDCKSCSNCLNLLVDREIMKNYIKFYRYIADRCFNETNIFDQRFLNISNDFDYLLKEYDYILEIVVSLKSKLTKLGKISEEIVDGQALFDCKIGILNVKLPIQRIVDLDKLKFNIFQLFQNNLKCEKKISKNQSFSLQKNPNNSELSSLQISKAFLKNLQVSCDSRKSIKLGDVVWALTSLVNSSCATWSKAKIIEISELFSNNFYKVSFIASHRPDLFLKSNQIAHFEAPKSLLKIATKVVAILNYKNNTFFSRDQLFSGVVAEPPKQTNKFRYLIFFDSGVSAYVDRNHVFILVEDNMSPLNDISQTIKLFRKKYFKDYPERAMVKFQLNEKIKVLVNDHWEIGKVKEIDCSLVKLYFKSINKYEWIFRGSFRLQPLSHFAFCIMPKSNLIKPKHRAVKKTIDHRCKNFKKRSKPFVQYTIDVSDDENSNFRRQFAKKSTSQYNFLQTQVDHESEKNFEKTSTKYKYDINILHKPERRAHTKQYVIHFCDSNCLNNVNENSQLFRDENPFTVPIIFGWERQQAVYRLWPSLKPKIYIYYIAPCGRRLKSIQEVDFYLNLTKSIIPIDFFTFSKNLRLYVEYKHGLSQKCHYYEEDIANGTENHSISVINSENYEKINNFLYSASRFAKKEINLNLDPDFLPCCDCKDNCQNRNYCQCQQITIESSYITPIFSKKYVGYKHRRLPYVQMSGIFECNSRCSCNNLCPNRLVQMGMRVRLQIFRTKEKGWGIRTLHDIPRGTFICIYAAELLNGSMADNQGINEGDEYLADLNYIESIEAVKLDYESAVEEEISSDDDFFSSDEKKKNEPFYILKDLSSKKIKLIQTENSKKPFVPIRELFNEKFTYTLDAKRGGNIGKYINHSCEPNCFVQNVFIDTHDLRFPWVSFFAGSFISAFSEITWNYHYEYDPDSKERIHCYCRSKICQGRLL